MQLKAAMIEYILLKKGLAVRLAGDPECVVSKIRRWEGGFRESQVLYVSETAFGSAGQTKSHARVSSVVIMPAAPDADGRLDEAPFSLSGASLIEAVHEARHVLESWEIGLHEALLEGSSFDDFLALGSLMFEEPLAYIDRNLITLGRSEGYWNREDSRMRGGEPQPDEGQMPHAVALDLVEDQDYAKASEMREPFYYQDAHQKSFYCVNTYDADAYLARLVLSLPEGVHALHPGEKQLVKVFHAQLDRLHLRYAGNAGIMAAQNDSLHALVRAGALDAVMPADENVSFILSSYGWGADDDYIMIKIVFFEGVHWESVSLYLCEFFERAMSDSCAFTSDREIVWLVNLKQSSRVREPGEKSLQPLKKTLVDVLRNYACKAGFSSVFDDFSSIPARYVQAGKALELGQARRPHDWYYQFDDYLFEYLLLQCAHELDAVHVSHPALLKLIGHDAKHGSEYARTLVCYLRNSKNTTHAAEELFIHRTSFMRRMAQMESITPIDLDDPDEVLHILLSAKLLGM